MSKIEGRHLVMSSLILATGAVFTASVVTGHRVDWSWVLAVGITLVVFWSRIAS